MNTEHFVSQDHALRAGMLIGHLMGRGLDVSPETDADHNYTDVIAVDIPRLENTGFLTVRLKVLPPE